MGCHLPYGITQCYLPPDTSERAPPNPSRAGWCSIYLPRRDGRLSWPSWLDSAPVGSRTSDLSITSPTPSHWTTKSAVQQLSSSSCWFNGSCGCCTECIIVWRWWILLQGSQQIWQRCSARARQCSWSVSLCSLSAIYTDLIVFTFRFYLTDKQDGFSRV